MAGKTIFFKNPKTGQVRNAPVGFSWTVLFFNFFPPLFRNDWKWAFIMFLIGLVTVGFSSLVFMFIYNKLYIKDLIGKGFKAENVSGRTLAQVSRELGIDLTTGLSSGERPNINITGSPVQHEQSAPESREKQAYAFASQGIEADQNNVAAQKGIGDFTFASVLWGGVAVVLFGLFTLENGKPSDTLSNSQQLEAIKSGWLNSDGTKMSAKKVAAIKKAQEFRAKYPEPRGYSRYATNTDGGGLTSVDQQVLSEYERRRKAGDIRGACGAMMYYSGPSARSAKTRIASTCAGYGVSTFSGINGY